MSSSLGLSITPTFKLLSQLVSFSSFGVKVCEYPRTSECTRLCFLWCPGNDLDRFCTPSWTVQVTYSAPSGKTSEQPSSRACWLSPVGVMASHKLETLDCSPPWKLQNGLGNTGCSQGNVHALLASWSRGSFHNYVQFRHTVNMSVESIQG
jgi:hypothetical protein